MNVGSAPGLPADGVFRTIRAILAYDSDDSGKGPEKPLKDAFSGINVNVLSLDELQNSDKEYDVLGLLYHNPLSNRLSLPVAPGSIKIGFYYGKDLKSPRKTSKKLDATIICLGSLTRESALQNTIFHFFESLTLPSLLNIDLSDLRSIATGMGLSFHYEANTSTEIVNKLHSEIFAAKSALLHFTCSRDVTLQELYSISKRVTLRSTTNSQVAIKREIDSYRRMNLKMGVRVLGTAESRLLSKRARIALTAILFGI